MNLIQTIAFVAVILIYAGGPILFCREIWQITLWYLTPIILYVTAVEFLRAAA